MEAASVLDQGPLPGDGQSQEKRIETSVIEPLADVLARGDEKPLLVIGDGGKGGAQRTSASVR